MTTIKMDRELVMAVRDAIAADVERFDMGTWFSGTLNKVVPAAKVMEGCGTTGCLAGHAVVEYAKLHNEEWVVSGESVWTSGAFRPTSVSTMGSHVLSGNLSGNLGTSWCEDDDAWSALFQLANWPTHYQNMVGDNSHADQAKAVIELLDDILDEITVWKKVPSYCALGPSCDMCLPSFMSQWVYLPDEAS